MRFMFKDLMVTVLRDSGRMTEFGAWGCCVSYGHPHSHCGPCGSVISCPLPTIHHLEDLVILKRDLQVALAQVEAAEAVAREQMKPQSVEEAELLERRLSGALEEVRRQKETLRRPSAEEE